MRRLLPSPDGVAGTKLGTMKHTQRCPKCDSRKMWRIQWLGAAENSAPGGWTSTTSTIRLAARRKRQSGDDYTAGGVDIYACAECTYSELWSRGLDELEHNPDEGVELIDATPKGTYR